MSPADYTALAHALVPEAALVGGGLAAIGADLSGLRHRALSERFVIATGIGVFAVLTAAHFAFHMAPTGEVFGGVLRIDALAWATRLAVCLLTLLVFGLGLGGRVPRHPAEYVALVLFAAAGFSLMAAAQGLLLMFLALETASLSLYVLAGFEAWRPESAEASLKYFLYGSLSAAFLLFGFSLIYGLTGSVDFAGIAPAVAASGFTPALGIATVMVLVAFGFKIAAAPFHVWAPDVYQGSPTPAAALIASGSKLASFVFFLRLFWGALAGAAGSAASWHGLAHGWLGALAMLAACSLLLGNVVALAQSNVRCLLAYSAIAHSGVLLLGVMTAGSAGVGPVFYYAATYGIAVAGVFGVLAAMERTGSAQAITDLAGLRRRSPFLAACLFVFVLSLAGIPPLAGFLGKFLVFAAALQVGGPKAPAGILALGGIFLSAVGLYYYLLILKQALVIPAAEGSRLIRVPRGAKMALGVAAGLLVALGVWPSVILSLF